MSRMFAVLCLMMVAVTTCFSSSSLAQPAHLVKDMVAADQPSSGAINNIVPIRGDRSLIQYRDGAGTWIFDAASKQSWSLESKVATRNQYEFGVVNGNLYLSGDDGVHGFELWQSDGTPEGTAPFVNANPRGISWFSAREVVRRGDDIYFFGNSTTRSGVVELWKANQSTGAVQLINRFEPSQSGIFLSPQRPYPTPNGFFSLLWAAGAVAETGYELWYTDASSGDTRRVYSHKGDFSDHGLTASLTVLGDSAFFVYYDYSSSSSPQLWQSDGTVAGTRAMDAPLINENSSLLEIYPANDCLYLAVRSNTSVGAGQLWVYKDAQFIFIRELAPGQRVDILVDREQNSAFFITRAESAGPLALARTDGTPDGTTIIQTFPELVPHQVTFLGKAGSDVLFADQSESNRALWRSNGTADGTVVIAPLDGDVTALYALANQTIVYQVGRSIWRTDGSAAGTSLLKTFALNSSRDSTLFTTLTASGNYVVVSEDKPGIVAPTLFVTDGTVAGSADVAIAGPSGSPAVSNRMILGDRLLFSVLGAEGNLTPWLSTSDGSDVQPASQLSVTLSSLENFHLLGSANGAQIGTSGDQLWRIDPITGEASSLDVISVEQYAYGASLRDAAGREWLYFAGSSGVDFGLWKTDGTIIGTTLVRNFQDLGVGDGYRQLDWLTPVGDKIYFRVSISYGHAWLGVSDGTPDGTRVVADIPTLSDGTFATFGPGRLTNVNGILFFFADDGVHGLELWRSDGTGEGTRMVKDVHPNDLWWAFGWQRAVKSTLYYMFNDGVHGWELWKSDGSAEGTVMVKDINPNGDSWAFVFGEKDGKLLLTADDGEHGTELWSSDGTSEGTKMLKDINPTGSGVELDPLLDGRGERNGITYFGANDGVHGTELWQTDGTPEGTVIVQDIAPGAASSTPSNLIIAGDNLYFSADDGAHGRELWAMPVDAPGGGEKLPENSGGGGAWDVFISMALMLVAFMRALSLCMSKISKLEAN